MKTTKKFSEIILTEMPNGFSFEVYVDEKILNMAPFCDPDKIGSG